ncbi:MAG TPA: UDP-N-acetylmuramoyl-L-alanyl-D-glutamate--2,6-diaminopimelate ligase [Xanthomonadales bacterium]|nr:UDP-N-acetylmuramoyl-L-alanyl-D-glutamate--2,6-diaminopimelate ligase [Xanthomonadales bacterium]
MSLQTLLEGWLDDVPELMIDGITLDSRKAGPGMAFIAVEGGQAHGMQFAPQAESAGASVIIHDGKFSMPPMGIPCVEVPGLAYYLSSLASRFFHAPSEHLKITGITGTNGKTTTAHLIAQAWHRVSGNAGMIGTIGGGPFNHLEPAALTTPDPISLQRLLSECVDQGVEQLAMEVSSHALDQGRCEEVRFEAGVFTNLSRDHLDYHGSMEAYAAAKRRLFSDHKPRFAIINKDDAFGKQLIEEFSSSLEVLSYGTNGSSEIRAAISSMNSDGMTVTIKSPWGDGTVRTGLLGRFNVSNLAAAIGALALQGMEWNQVLHQVELMHAIPGRMHKLGGEGGKPVVVVDFAHTPAALEQALQALRAHLHGRMVCVIGCGGDRDRGKRPMMAQVAEAGCDRIIFTSDNPRFESQEKIFADMVAGMSARERATLEPDRGEAIRHAVESSREGDIVLIAGKGHETFQDLGDTRVPFSDEEAALAALEAA